MVRYKNPSENFKKITDKAISGNLRSSLGKENIVQEYYNMDIDNLIPYAKQSRLIFDNQEITHLAESIKNIGITTPLQVIASKNFIDKFEVISGERRLRAAKLVGIKKLPCIIIAGEDKIEEISLIENIQRSDLHPIEFANGLTLLMEKHDWGDITRLAKKIGKSQSTVSEHLTYSKLPSKIKDYLIKNNIKSRAMLRKAVNLQSEKFEIFLKKMKGTTNLKKNIIKIYLINKEFHTDDQSILKLEYKELLNLKIKIKHLTDKIDNLIKQ